MLPLPYPCRSSRFGWSTTLQTIQQSISPWWCRSPLQQHGCGKSVSPTPRSLFGRGWARVVFKGFAQFNDAAEKKEHFYSQQIYLLFYIPPDSFATKMMESRFPHAPPLSNLLAFLSSITPTCFWLVVAFEISIGSHLTAYQLWPFMKDHFQTSFMVLQFLAKFLSIHRV